MDEIDQIEPNKTNVDLIRLNKIKVDRMDRLGINWTEYDQSGFNGPNKTEVDVVRTK